MIDHLLWALGLLCVLGLAAIGERQRRNAVHLRSELTTALANTEHKFAAYADYRARVSQLLADLQRATDFEALARVFMTQASAAIGAHYGLFYVFDQDSQRLRPVAGYGLTGCATEQRSYALGEGMVGQHALNQRPVTLIPLPDTLIRIKSGLGLAVPKQLLLQTLVQNGKTVGAVEFAALSAFNPSTVEFMTELMPTLAMSIEILDRSLRTQALLEAEREQAEQLERQQAALQEAFIKRDTANQQLQSQIEELAAARRAMLNIMEDLDESRRQAEASMPKSVGTQTGDGA